MDIVIKNILSKWALCSSHVPIKITSEDLKRSIGNLDNNPDWRIVEFNCSDYEFNRDRIGCIEVFHRKTEKQDEKTVFVFLRMSGPQIDEYDTSISATITSRTPMVIQFNIDESAAPYTDKVEDYFIGIERAITAPKYH